MHMYADGCGRIEHPERTTATHSDSDPYAMVLAYLDHHNRCRGGLRSVGDRAGSGPEAPEGNETPDQSHTDVGDKLRRLVLSRR
jgi:hypothetical protein